MEAQKTAIIDGTKRCFGGLQASASHHNLPYHPVLHNGRMGGPVEARGTEEHLKNGAGGGRERDSCDGAVDCDA
jgi:hypothetical protein